MRKDLLLLGERTIPEQIKAIVLSLSQCMKTYSLNGFISQNTIKPLNAPSLEWCCCLPLSFFFLWSCLNSHLALPLSSSRSSTKQGAWGVFTHFPSPLSYTLITGLELLDNAESVASPHPPLSGCFTCEYEFTSSKLHLHLMTFSSD